MLIPQKINFLASVEVIRDGGSLAATFQCIDSINYWLLFPLKRVTSYKTIKPPEKDYLEPVLIDRHSDIEQTITWEQAETWLFFIGQLVQNEEDKHVFDFMSKITEQKIKDNT